MTFPKNDPEVSWSGRGGIPDLLGRMFKQFEQKNVNRLNTYIIKSPTTHLMKFPSEIMRICQNLWIFIDQVHILRPCAVGMRHNGLMTRHRFLPGNARLQRSLAAVHGAAL